MIDLSTVMISAFGAASLGIAFLHYRITKNGKTANSPTK